jgi:hypothetical protein
MKFDIAALCALGAVNGFAPMALTCVPDASLHRDEAVAGAGGEGGASQPDAGSAHSDE